MQFDMLINASEFTENKLKVLSSVPLQVLVKDEAENVVEEITTAPEQMIYTFAKQLTKDMTVEVKLIPGHPVEFYPVVNAL